MTFQIWYYLSMSQTWYYLSVSILTQCVVFIMFVLRHSFKKQRNEWKLYISIRCYKIVLLLKHTGWFIYILISILKIISIKVVLPVLCILSCKHIKSCFQQWRMVMSCFSNKWDGYWTTFIVIVHVFSLL